MDGRPFFFLLLRLLLLFPSPRDVGLLVRWWLMRSVRPCWHDPYVALTSRSGTQRTLSPLMLMSERLSDHCCIAMSIVRRQAMHHPLCLPSFPSKSLSFVCFGRRVASLSPMNSALQPETCQCQCVSFEKSPASCSFGSFAFGFYLSSHDERDDFYFYPVLD